ncbi:MAG TPA: MFS transporter [Jatrophihabitantaceae bacterium]
MTPRRSAALSTVLGVLALTFLDTTIVSVTLGNIQYHLGSGVIPLQWVINAYSLAFAGLMLLAGSLSDRYGRKSFMVGGIVVFCAGSLLCALAPSVGWVIAGRAVMGVGAAASEPGTLSVIRQLFPDRAQRARALGGWAAVSGLSLALGPVLGGVLVAVGDWRDVFWFNLVAGIVLLAATLRWVPNSADPQTGRIDTEGFALGTVALVCLIFGGITGEQYGYGRPWIIALFAVSGLCFVAFVMVERRATNPMLDLRYLRNPAIGVALFVAFAVYFGVFSIFFLTALYLDVIVGYSGGRLALLFVPMAVAIVLGSLGSGRWVARVGARWPMVTGCLLGAAGVVVARYLLTTTPSFGWLTAAVALAGLGFGIAVVPLTSAVLGHVPAARSGMAASTTNTARQLGSVVGVAALGAIVNGYLRSDFGASLRASSGSSGQIDYIIGLLETGGPAAKGIDLAHPPQLIKALVDAAAAAFRVGMHIALWVSAGLILAAAVATLLVPRRAMAPDAEVDQMDEVDQLTSTGSTSAGSAPPSTASTGTE